MKSSKDLESLQELYDIGLIWKQGFPLGVNADVAITQATSDAVTQSGVQGSVVQSQIISDADHTANGEFLVVLYFGTDKTD